MTVEQSIGLDTTRAWVDSYRVNGKVKPALYVRYATDTNYMQASDKAIMNLGLPGQRVPNITQWQVTEQLDQVVQEATLTCMNCMLLSQTQTTIAGGSSLTAATHSASYLAQWTTSPKGADAGQLIEHDGNYPISHWSAGSTFDLPTGTPQLVYDESDVAFRMYDFQTFDVTSTAGFPNPALPNDEDGNDVEDIKFLNNSLVNIPLYTITSGAVGPYYILVDEEIIRVCNLSGTTFYIPPGGRGIAGTAVAAHAAGAPVTLLNFGPYTGDWVGLGYLNVDSYSPQTSPMRIGTCLSIYEGYGNLSTLNHDNSNQSKNYTFSGYWFVTGVEPSLQSDGTPLCTISLASSGHMIDAQEITPTLVSRLGETEAQWKDAVWGTAEIDRTVPSQWIGFQSWDPTEMNAYPLTLSTFFAQNKAYFDHTQPLFAGTGQCLICNQDTINWLLGHGYPGTIGTKVVPQLVDAENRVLGMHIYKESIRVNETAGGPLKTYVELMAILAMWSWDHPALGTQLAQFFTKIPNKLYDAMRNIHTGLCFNGQLSINVDSKDPDNNGISNATYPWFNPSYVNVNVVGGVTALLCPFTSSYDQVPFTQPMQDLALVNSATLWFSREGYPCFVPQFFKLRPNGLGYKTYSAFTAQDSSQKLPAANGEWFLAYGSSISEYSNSFDPTQVFTVAACTGTLPYDGSTVQMLGGGTGLMDGKRIMYSPMGGNKDGLAMTSGISKSTTVSLDNIMLGLSWDTRPASWGVNQLISPSSSTTGQNFVLNGKPPLYEGNVLLGGKGTSFYHNSTSYPDWVVKVGKTVNFFLLRNYVNFVVSGAVVDKVNEEGKYDDLMVAGVAALQKYLHAYFLSTAGKAATPPATDVSRTDGVYDNSTFKAITNYLNANAYEIQTDIYWYAVHQQSWDEYVGAITGVPVLFNSSDSFSPGSYAVDDQRTQELVANWAKDNFAKPLVNVANMTVDASINHSVVTSVSVAMADPRIQPGDTVWLDVPGHATQQSVPPYTNGIYVTQTSRTMDLVNSTYTGTLSGCRYIADQNQLYQTAAVTAGFTSLTRAGDV